MLNKTTGISYDKKIKKGEKNGNVRMDMEYLSNFGTGCS